MPPYYFIVFILLLVFNQNVFSQEFYFVLNIPGQASSGSAHFKEVSGLSLSLSDENRYQNIVPSHTNNTSLVFIRGLAENNSALANWMESSMKSNDSKPVVPKNIQVSLLDNSGAVISVWTVYNAFPIQLSASKSDKSLLIESVEFNFLYFERIK